MRQARIAFIISKSVNNREDIKVIATIIIMMGDTKPADTAASPKTNAPKIEIAEPQFEGKRTSDSLNISQIKRVNIHSKKAGKGTSIRCF